LIRSNPKRQEELTVEEDVYTKRRKGNSPHPSCHPKVTFFKSKAELSSHMQWSASKVCNPNVETSLKEARLATYKSDPAKVALGVASNSCNFLAH